jgi:hypothetical protein
MPKRGTVREDGLVYIRKSRNKEVWGTQEQFENLIKKSAAYIERKRNESRNSTNKKWKLGEYNPDIGLYFIRKTCNQSIIWGTAEQLQTHREKRKKMRLDYKSRIQPNKKNVIESFEIRRKRGDLDPILNLYFYKYNSTSGNEMWLTKEKFDSYQAKQKNRKKLKKNL